VSHVNVVIVLILYDFLLKIKYLHDFDALIERLFYSVHFLSLFLGRSNVLVVSVVSYNHLVACVYVCVVAVPILFLNLFQTIDVLNVYTLTYGIVFSFKWRGWCCKWHFFIQFFQRFYLF